MHKRGDKKLYKTDIGMKRAIEVLKNGLFITIVLLLYICSYFYNSCFHIQTAECGVEMFERIVTMLEYALMTLTLVTGGSLLYVYTE